jgi:hypothetical protein
VVLPRGLRGAFQYTNVNYLHFYVIEFAAGYNERSRDTQNKVGRIVQGKKGKWVRREGPMPILQKTYLHPFDDGVEHTLYQARRTLE